MPSSGRPGDAQRPMGAAIRVGGTAWRRNRVNQPNGTGGSASIGVLGLHAPGGCAWQLDELSRADRQVLDETWRDFGHMSQWDIRDYTHKHCPEWEDPLGSSNPIPYERVFKFLGKTDAAELAEAVRQESRGQQSLRRVEESGLPIFGAMAWHDSKTARSLICWLVFAVLTGLSLWCAYGTTATQLAEKFANQAVASVAQTRKQATLDRLRKQRDAMPLFRDPGSRGRPRRRGREGRGEGRRPPVGQHGEGDRR